MGTKVEQYEQFFQLIQKFQEEQQKQKQRGLNNYNILTSVLRKSDEVKLHSRMIFSFLDTNGYHYQSSLFLEKFLNVLNLNNFKIDTQNCSVYKEYQSIDLYITDGNKHLIIENKIYATDQPSQIKRYIETIINDNAEISDDDLCVVYLSLDREKPSLYSLGKEKDEDKEYFEIEDNKLIYKGNDKLLKDRVFQYRSIYYKKEILEWLELSQYEVQNITNLNEAFNQYIDVVKMLTNQYKEKIMSLSNYIKENESIYKMAMEIRSVLPKVRKDIIDNFFDNVVISLQQTLGNDWCVELVPTKDLSKKYGFPLRIYKKKWFGEEGHNLIFGFEFQSNDYYNGQFGIVRKNDKVDIKKDIAVKFKNQLEKLNINLKTNRWWLYWERLPKIDGYDDFVEYAMSYKNAEQGFVDAVMDVINLFEIKSHLMTDMNNYLNQKRV